MTAQIVMHAAQQAIRDGPSQAGYARPLGRSMAALGFTHNQITAMADEPELLANARRIRDALDVGAADNGNDVVLNVRMEDGSTEWFSIHHSKVGRFIAGIMFASGAAARDRSKQTQLGNPLPELSTVIDIKSFNVSAVPGEDFVFLRLTIGEGVNLDFRIPLAAVPAIEEKLRQATVLAQSGKPPPSH